ncbi:redoxin domain-containing protein [Candidatus Poribacteria bacterium]|nr:redoxin domain-containing protein [Candidatus Poribacteria bacterium]
MRAGPLSSPKVINLLNTHFVNVWVLLRDVPELQAGVKGAAAAALATKLRQNYTDSVDILTLTPDLEVIGHLHNMSLFHPYYLPRSERIPQYVELLKSAAGVEVKPQKSSEDINEANIEKSIADLEAKLQLHPDDESFFYIYRILIRLYIEAGREKDIDQLIDRFKIVNRKTFLAQIYEELGNTERAMEYRSKVTPPLALLGKTVSDFSATDLDGKPISLQQYRGKVVLLDFWAVWNSFCIGDILNIKEMYETYKDQGFAVIGVSLDTDETKLRSLLKKNNIPWRQIYSGEEKQCPLVKQYDVKSIPARWLIDRDGTLIAHEANHKLMSCKGREVDLERLVATAVADKPKHQ